MSVPDWALGQCRDRRCQMRTYVERHRAPPWGGDGEQRGFCLNSHCACSWENKRARHESRKKRGEDQEWYRQQEEAALNEEREKTREEREKALKEQEELKTNKEEILNKVQTLAHKREKLECKERLLRQKYGTATRRVTSRSPGPWRKRTRSVASGPSASRRSTRSRRSKRVLGRSLGRRQRAARAGDGRGPTGAWRTR
jgi:hypothetical protein